MKTVTLLFFTSMFLSLAASAQEPCEFKPQNKKGGHYLFSTFYLDDLKTPREGVCQTLHMGKIYERRVFVKGRLVEETCNSLEGKPRVQSKFTLWDGDSLLIDQKVYYENGPLQTHNIIFLDASGRRCMKSVEYGLTGHKRFEHTYAWIRYSELNESDKSTHPPHTVDEDGYTYLMVPIGEEKIYDPFTGALTQVRHHQFIGDGNHENSSLNGPSTEYYENGKIKVKANYKDGALNGLYQSFHLDGTKQSEGTYENGIKVGQWKGWHPNGKPFYDYLFDLKTAHPFEPNKKEWAENGQLTLEQVLDESGTGYLREWTPKGIKTHDVDIYLLDHTRGVETWWYDNGQMHWKRDYRKGQDTSLIEYYKNGNWARLEVFKETHKDSYREVRRWYEKQIPQEIFIQEQRADSFSLQSQELFYNSGVKKSWIQYKNKESYKELYATNGTKILYRYTVNDSLQGPYQLFDSLGNILLDYRYENGLRNGWCREYNAEGEVLFAKLYQSGIPIQDSASVERKVDQRALTAEEQNGLTYFIQNQSIDSTLFSKDAVRMYTTLIYQHFPNLLGPLPENEIHGFIDYHPYTTLQLQRLGSCVVIHINNRFVYSGSIIVYPDMEMEPFNQLYTKSELRQIAESPSYQYMWKD